MFKTLYLDTARFGQMSPSAQAAVGDYLRCVSEAGISPHLDDLLLHGWQAWPMALQCRFPHLSTWPGLSNLRNNLKQVVNARAESRVVFANRSSQLMQFAGQLFFGPCRNVLITDCTWPNYESILKHNLGNAGRSVSKVRVRKQMLRGQMSKGGLIDHLTSEFVRRKCDGLFLPSVDNFGLAFPVKEIVERISQLATLRFVVIDGAQAFCHVPANLTQDYCDFYFTGCHKWLGSGLPMGVGFYGKRRSAGYIETRLEQALEFNAVSDPLLRFSDGLLRGVPYPFGETVNLLPLFACAGALCDLELRDVERNAMRKKHRQDALIETATSQGWHLFLPDETFRTAIVVARGPIPVMAQKAVNLRKRFAEQGVYLSSYSKGRIRLALPPRMLSQSELATFSQAMRAVANSKTTGNFGGRQSAVSGQSRTW